MKATVIKIGNSRGVRIPKPLIDESGLSDAVEITAEKGKIIITNASSPREGWEAAAAVMAARSEDALLDGPVATTFDDQEWQW